MSWYTGVVTGVVDYVTTVVTYSSDEDVKCDEKQMFKGLIKKLWE